MKLCSPQQAEGDSSHVKKKDKAGTISDSAHHGGEIHLVAYQIGYLSGFPFLVRI